MDAARQASLWLRAIDRLGIRAGTRVLAICMSAEPVLPALIARGADLRACDWHWTALRAASAVLPPERVQPWDGTSAPDLPDGFDVALCDLAYLSGRAAFSDAARLAATVLGPAGRLLVRAGNREGAGGAVRRLAEWFGTAEPIAYGGGARIVACPAGVQGAVPATPPPPPVSVRLGGTTLRLHPWPGVFAEGLPDAATRLLADTLAGRRPEWARAARACDVGCGGGALGLVLLASGLARCVLLDENLRALAAVRANLRLNGFADRGEPVPADAAAAIPGGPYPLVVCNPPFHAGPHENRRLGRAIVRACWAATAPGGRLFVVAHPFLRYEREVPELAEVASGDGFAVLTAARP